MNELCTVQNYRNWCQSWLVICSSKSVIVTVLSTAMSFVRLYVERKVLKAASKLHCSKMAALVQDTDSELVKAYIIRNLGDKTDADEDVLSDYIVALLKNPGPLEELRANCVEQLSDFITKDTAKFVDDIIQGVKNKAFLSVNSSAIPAPSLHSIDQPTSLKRSSMDIDDAPQAYREMEDRMRGRGRGGRGGRGGMMISGRGGRKNRCRDYDTKGFCLRGEMCPYEHGGDVIFLPPTAPGMQESYDPTNINPQHPPNPAFGVPGMSMMPPFPQMFSQIENGGGKRRRRDEARAPVPPAKQARDSFYVRNIPEASANEEAVRSYFNRFGTIEEITMQGATALVKFSTAESASAARTDPEPIFGNRFVRLDSVHEDKVMQMRTERFRTQIEEKEKTHLAFKEKEKEMEEKKQQLKKQEAEVQARQAQLRSKLAKQTVANGNKNGTNAETSSSKTFLRQRLAELQAEAADLGLEVPQSNQSFSYRGGYRGRAILRGRGRGGRGAANFSRKLDLRSNKVLIRDWANAYEEPLKTFLIVSQPL